MFINGSKFLVFMSALKHLKQAFFIDVGGDHLDLLGFAKKQAREWGRHDPEIYADLEIDRLSQQYFVDSGYRSSYSERYQPICERARKELMSPPAVAEVIVGRQNIVAELMKDPVKLKAIVKITLEGLDEKRDFSDESRDISTVISAARDYMAALAVIEQSFPACQPFSEFQRAAKELLQTSGLGATMSKLEALLKTPLHVTANLDSEQGKYFLDGKEQETDLRCLASGVKSAFRTRLIRQMQAFPALFGTIENCLELYIALAQYGLNLKEQGLPCCFPVIMADRPGHLIAKDFCNPLLGLDELKITSDGDRAGPTGQRLHFPQDMCPHDYDNSNANAHVVVGRNAGSKSTYIVGRGLIPLMTQIGGPLPASYCEHGIIRAIRTAFVRQVDIGAGHSTFTHNLDRVGQQFREAKRGDLLLFDDITEGTEPTNAIDFMHFILGHVHSAGLQVYMATQQRQLAQENLPGTRIYTTVPDTYKIVSVSEQRSVEANDWRKTAVGTKLEKHLR